LTGKGRPALLHHTADTVIAIPFNCVEYKMPKVITTKEWIGRAKEKHGTQYSYAKTDYLGAAVKVEIICRSHGAFWQSPTNHLGGSGCPECKKLSISSKLRSSTPAFIKKAVEVHGSKYDYRKVDYRKNSVKVEIVCKKHGSFPQTPSDHLAGFGCPSCGYESVSKHRSGSLEEFIRAAKKKHGSRYDYSETEYKNSDTKVKIICEKHGPFYQYTYSHLAGHGCQGCCNGSSSMAIAWIEAEARRRKLRKVQHARKGGEFRIPGTRIRVDGYHALSKTVFEFHGDDFHGNPRKHSPRSKPNPFSNKTAGRLYKETLEREDLIRSLGYNLIVMWEHDFKISRRGTLDEKRK
jgi:hypothetical protein